MTVIVFAVCTTGAAWFGWWARGRRDNAELDLLTAAFARALEDCAEARRQSARWQARAIAHPTTRNITGRRLYDQDDAS
jgi:hypothetical protein